VKAGRRSLRAHVQHGRRVLNVSNMTTRIPTMSVPPAAPSPPTPFPRQPNIAGGETVPRRGDLAGEPWPHPDGRSPF
jgi:hypothetical protein